MSTVPADQNVFGVRVCCNPFDIEILPSIELNPREEYKRRTGSVFIDDFDDLLCAQSRFVRVLWLNQNHALLGIEIVMTKLRLHRILGWLELARTLSYNCSGDMAYMVAGKGLALQNDLELLFGGPVEACHEQVQVGCQSAHHSHFTLQSTHNRRHKLGASCVDIDEGRKQFIIMWNKVPCHAFGCPGSQVLFDIPLRTTRLDTQ